MADSADVNNMPSRVPKTAAVEPHHQPSRRAVDDPPTEGEIGRQVIALRGWRRVLAWLAGLLVDRGS